MITTIAGKQLKVWLDDDLRGLIEKAAERRGVGLSQEIRARLWHSFATAPEMIDAGQMRKTAIYMEAWRNGHL